MATSVEGRHSRWPLACSAGPEVRRRSGAPLHLGWPTLDQAAPPRGGLFLCGTAPAALRRT